MKGRIHSFETLGAVDGPGLRFVIFMQGCKMRCKYCHNPDTWEFSDGVDIESSKLVQEILKYKKYYANGGVTISGGDPLHQINFITEIAINLKQEGLNVAVDTSGAVFDKNDTTKIDKLMKYVDIVLLDIKHLNLNEHKELTGHTNENTLNFLEYLNKIGKNVWIRRVLLKGVSDSEEELINLVKMVNKLSIVSTLELLPFHTMGFPKYEQIGIPNPLKEHESYNLQDLNECVKIVKEMLNNDITLKYSK